MCAYVSLLRLSWWKSNIIYKITRNSSSCLSCLKRYKSVRETGFESRIFKHYDEKESRWTSSKKLCVCFLLNSYTTWNYTGNPINVLCLIICSGKQQQNKSLLNSRLLYICVTLLRLNPASRWIFISAFISKQIFWLRVKDTGFTVYLYFHCKNLDNSIGGHLNWSIGLLVTSSISVDKRSHNKKQALQELITIPSASKVLLPFYMSWRDL